MKNLICTLALLVSVFITVQAQQLGVKVTNNTANTWHFKIGESNGGQLQLLNIPPGGSAAGVIPPNVALPFTWGAEELGLGCGGASGFQIPGSGSGSETVCGHIITWTCFFSPLIPQSWVVQVTIN
jgi:hypothetical protein